MCATYCLPSKLRVTMASLCSTAAPDCRNSQCKGRCLERGNQPLSSNLVVWCAKIGPKTKKVQKTSELAKQMSKNDSMVFHTDYGHPMKA